MNPTIPSFLRAILRSAVGVHGFERAAVAAPASMITMKWDDEYTAEVEWALGGEDAYWTRLYILGKHDAWDYYLDIGFHQSADGSINSVLVNTEMVAFPCTHHERLYGSRLHIRNETEWGRYVQGIMLPLFEHGRNLEEEEEMAKSGDDTEEEIPPLDDDEVWGHDDDVSLLAHDEVSSIDSDEQHTTAALDILDATLDIVDIDA